MAAPAPTLTKERLAPDLGLTESRDRSAFYWCGMVGKKPPKAFLNIGPVTFPQWHTPWEGAGHDGAGRRGQYPGVVCRLSESHISRLKDMLKRGVMRWRSREGTEANGQEYYLDTPEVIEAARKKWRLTEDQVAEYAARSEKPADGDEALSMHVYCVKVNPPDGANLNSWRPGPVPASVYELGLEAP